MSLEEAIGYVASDELIKGDGSHASSLFLRSQPKNNPNASLFTSQQDEYMKCEVIECCESLKNVLNVLAVGENEKSSKKVLNNLLKITLLPMPQKLINPTLFQMMLTYGSSFGTSISMELEHQVNFLKSNDTRVVICEKFQYCRPSGCYGDAVIIHLCSAM
ncbi:uncharacterized protein LOC116404763 isoform X3 [Cucumis sativus]|uniref:uncharacterized protein LOC116404763 isoform X3 n=1 Tax=Cucumis sativus TaxID=3659 RepID=UPI0012F4E52B|nr:uncharacterized protein LOC116404763 isoform X3 [Cucumis sativus]